MARTKKTAKAKRHAQIPNLSTDIILTAAQKAERKKMWQRLQSQLASKVATLRNEEARRHKLLLDELEQKHRLQQQQQQQVCRLTAVWSLAKPSVPLLKGVMIHVRDTRHLLTKSCLFCAIVTCRQENDAAQQRTEERGDEMMTGSAQGGSASEDA